MSRSALQAVGHLVDRRRGDDEQAEAGEQQQDGDGEPGRERRCASGSPSRKPTRPPASLGRPGGRVTTCSDAERAERQRGPAEDEPAAAALAVGVAQHAPGRQGEQQRQQQRALAERAGETSATVSPGAAGVPPGAAGGDERGGEQQQAEAVAAVRRVEVLGAAGGGAGGAADARGRGEARARPATARNSARTSRATPWASWATRPGRRCGGAARLLAARGACGPASWRAGLRALRDRAPLPVRGRVA